MGEQPDNETELTPEEPTAETIGGEEEPEIAEDADPGATDLLRAAKEGAERLKKLEP